MNDSIPQKRKRYATPERVNLVKATTSILDGWLKQLSPRLQGVKVTRSDLVNWLLKRRSITLSEKELASLEQELFDPIKALEAAVVEAKKKVTLGEDIDLTALINDKVLRKKVHTRRKTVSKSEKMPNSSLREHADT